MAGLLNSIYIHIPFCESKCHYCNFISYTGKESCIKEYFNALNKEISHFLNYISNKEFKTVYIGGGTPSLIDGFFYAELLSGINLSENAEISIEANPGAVPHDYLQNLRDAGFNRISLGVQSFNNEILKRLNRLHTSEEAVKTVDNAKRAGFSNISIDLIYGLPGQGLSDWANTLHRALELDINHISTYGLKIEEDTKFYRNPPENLPDEDLCAEMYLRGIEILEKNGFEHYEISNFARAGFRSRHNLAYWNNEEYLGIGAAAHGYINAERYSNKTDLEDYIKNPLEKQKKKKLTPQQILEEKIFLGLRLRSGIDLEEPGKFYRVNLLEKYKKIIEKYTELNLMGFRKNKLYLTRQGVLLSNDILADFLF